MYYVWIMDMAKSASYFNANGLQYCIQLETHKPLKSTHTIYLLLKINITKLPCH